MFECSARENCHIKELFQTLFSLSGLPRIIERYGPMLKKGREMKNHFHGNQAKMDMDNDTICPRNTQKVPWAA